MTKKIGRPSKYDERYCDKLIDHMSKGYSYETFGHTIGVCKATTQNWEKQHKEFLAAKKKGFEACQYHWEKIGLDGLNEKSFNATVWIYNMKNRFRNTDTWGPEEQESPTFNFNLAYDPKKLGKDE